MGIGTLYVVHFFCLAGVEANKLSKIQTIKENCF